MCGNPDKYVKNTHYRSLPIGWVRTMITNSIKHLRFNQDQMTQQNLAERIGVTRQTVNAIEASKYSPSLEVAFRIATVFEVPLDQVFQYESNQVA